MAPLSTNGYVRRATHAGTWYSSDPRALARQVGGWFADVRGGPTKDLSAVIGPHAGYTYCGRVLAHAYKHLDPTVVCVRNAEEEREVEEVGRAGGGRWVGGRRLRARRGGEGRIRGGKRGYGACKSPGRGLEPRERRGEVRGEVRGGEGVEREASGGRRAGKRRTGGRTPGLWGGDPRVPFFSHARPSPFLPPPLVVCRNRVVVLGPSHHFYARRSLLSSATALETPFGTLPVDRQAVASLASSGLFDSLSRSEDEEEHSIEMHLPMIAYVASKAGKGLGTGAGPAAAASSAGRRRRSGDLASSEDSSEDASDARASPSSPSDSSSSQLSLSVVPIVVGDLSSAEEARLGKLLEPLLSTPGTLLAASTDFCHWGRRFGYVRRDPSLPVYESIQALDARGMAAIESGDPQTFFAYEEETQNTICGRHAVGAVLHALGAQAKKMGWGEKGAKRARFLAYDQSSRAIDLHDSSVSYASAIVA